MKVFFTTSFWGKPTYQPYVDRILRAIESTGAQVISPEKTREYKSSFEKENIQKFGGDKYRVHYEFIRQGIANADAVIIEASHEDFRIGHEATLAIIYKKPVLCLSRNTDYGKLVLHEAFRGAKYTDKNVEKLVLSFLGEVSSQTLSKRSVPLSSFRRWPATIKADSAKSIGVLGAINIDLMTKVPFTPKENEVVISEGLRLLPGGKGTNAAIALSRLGQKPYMVGRIGNDVFGSNVMDVFRKEGVNTKFVDTDSFAPTGTVMLTVDERGQNSIIVNEDANIRIPKTTVADFFKGHDSRRLRMDALYTTLEPMPEIVEEAIVGAHKRKILVMLLASPQTRPLGRKLYGRVDFLAANGQQAGLMTGVDVNDPESAGEAAQQLVDDGASNVIITLGYKGAVLLQKRTHQCTYFPGFRVKEVDETAAGDAFCAGFLTTYLQTNDLKKSVRYANLCGAFAVTRLGAYEAMPTLDQLELFRPEVNPNLRPRL